MITDNDGKQNRIDNASTFNNAHGLQHIFMASEVKGWTWEACIYEFSNVMQFAEEYIGVSSGGLEQVIYLDLPAFAQAPIVSAGADSDEGWAAILELLFDDDAKTFAGAARDEGIPAASEDNIGYEVEGPDGEVIATVEIAWPDLKIGFLTEEQLDDKERLESYNRRKLWQEVAIFIELIRI